MLNIKDVRPKTKQKAIYVTEDNIKEFLEYAYSGKFNLDTLRIDKHEEPHIYATVECIDLSSESEDFMLDKWYVSLRGGDYGWCEEEYFNMAYDIEEF